MIVSVCVVNSIHKGNRLLLVSLFIRARQNRKNRVTLHKGFKRPKFGARIIHDTNNPEYADKTEVVIATINSNN